MSEGKRRDTRPLGHGPLPRHGTPVALRVLGSDREIPLPRDLERFAIGSDASNHLVLEDETVSSVHCVLERRGPHRLVVKDRRSTNGTYVEGMRVTESMIEAGARLRLGETQLTLVGREPAGQMAVLAQLVGEAPVFQRVVAQATRAARSHETVCMQGESGTGKELFARLVHEASPRAGAPFVAVNCAAIASTLVESELFGHEKGAFTGALARRLGVFEQANGGTLFLDEVGELPLRQQPKLLRVLESRRVCRLGGTGETPVDVRVVAATHRDLPAMIAAGDFRLDLFHRLAGIQLRLPALRERPGDLPLLVRHFLDELGPRLGPRRISDDTLRALALYPWPGNVRELRQAVHRAAAMSDRVLELEDLLPALTRRASPPVRATVPADDFGDDLQVDELMRHVLERALARHGSQRRAAQAIGMSRSTFNERVHRYGIVARRDASGERERDEEDPGEGG